MHFAKQCVLCLIGVLILETVFVHGIDIKPSFRAALRETADSRHHKKLHAFDGFDVGLVFFVLGFESTFSLSLELSS